MVPSSSANDHDRRRKSRGLVAAVCAAALAGGATAAEPASHYPPRTLLLVVAPWCASCYGELARLSEIAATARPFDVRVLLVEDGTRARAMVRGLDATRLWRPDEQDLRSTRADLLARTGGLPFSVATDDRGRICAEQNGSLNPTRARALTLRCRLS